MSGNWEGNDPKPAPRRSKGSFGDDMMFGLGIAAGPFILSCLFGGDRPNGVLIVSLIVFALWAWAIADQIVKRRSPVVLNVLAITLGTGLMTLGVLLNAGRTVADQYHAAPVVADFARNDFERFDSGGAGLLTSDQLQAILDRQSALKESLQKMEQATQAIDASPSNEADKTLAKLQMAVIEAGMRAQLLENDVIGPLTAVHAVACAAGHQIVPDDSHKRGVTKADLIGFKEKLDAEYPLWLSLLRRLDVL